MSSPNILQTNKKLIIFDFDGVIGNTFEQAYLAANAVSKEYGYHSFDTAEEFYNDLNVIPKNALKLATYRLKKYGIIGGATGIINHLKDLKKIKDDISKNFGPRLINSNVFEGIPELLENLKGKAEMLILSNNQADAIQQFLEKYNLANYFSEVHGFEKTMVKTEALKNIIEKRNIDLKNVVFVTDMASDVKDARPLKISVLAVTYGYNNYQKISGAKPSKIVSSVNEIYPALNAMLDL